jgi:non-ribosomal peptide synthetase component F
LNFRWRILKLRSERFEKVVDLYRDSIAIESGTDALTYAELNARANQIARTLVTQIAKQGTPVGLLVEKGAYQVAGMLGVLKSGNIFVPIDSSLPKDRIKTILDQSQSECLLTD